MQKIKSKKESENVIIDMSPTELETTGPKTKNGIVENSLFVKVRKEPNYESDVLEILREGYKVIILGRSGMFYKGGIAYG